jgi:putative protease
MKFTTFVTSREDIQECAKARALDEVLIEPATLSREGRLTIAEAEALAKEATAQNLTPILVWDILMTNDEFARKCEVVRGMNTASFSAIRTQCPGAAAWVREYLPEMKLHIVLENSNHNLPALKRWVADLRPERVVLSTQIPEDRLIQICKELDTQCEILGAGKILLFYSKRKLLQTNFGDTDDATDASWIYADSASEESSSRPFPTIENEHGTFMYLNKDHFILDTLSRLREGGMHTVRIDLRDLQEKTHSARGISDLIEHVVEQAPGLDTRWGRPTSAPFFKRNRTDKQAARMKPLTRLLRDENCLGEVVSVEREEVIGLLTFREFSTDANQFAFVGSDGRELPVQIENFSDLSGNSLTHCIAHRVVRCPWLKGVRPGSLLVRK